MKGQNTLLPSIKLFEKNEKTSMEKSQFIVKYDLLKLESEDQWS